MKRLALLMLLATPCVAQAEQSLSGVALALPLSVPGLEMPAPAVPQMDLRSAAPETPVARVADCAVSSDQIPPEFIKLMSRLDEPVSTREVGLPPAVNQIAPAVVQTQRNRSQPIQILNGRREVQHGRSRENGVTVYRGLEPERR